MSEKLSNLTSQENLNQGLQEVTTENLLILKEQMLEAYNEAERVILSINRELTDRGEKL